MGQEGEKPPTSNKGERIESKQKFVLVDLNVEQRELYTSVEFRFQSPKTECCRIGNKSTNQLRVIVYKNFDWENADPMRLNCLACVVAHTFGHKAQVKLDDQVALENFEANLEG